MIVILLDTFLSNYVPTLVLLESDVSWSFVSTSLSTGFSVPHDPLDRTLRLVILDKNMILVCDVYRGFVLDIFGFEFPINLIPITMGDFFVIVGMDWLSLHGGLIDCE